MNANDRKELDKAIALLEQAKEIIESIGQEEQDKFDNMTEGLQQTERGQHMEEVSSELSDKASSIEDIISEIEDLKN